MPFPSGSYLIRHQTTEVVIARNLIEDRSLLPKRTVVYPSDMDKNSAVWNIESLDDGHYRLSNRGGVAAGINGELYNKLIPTSDNEEWDIRPGSGPDTFTISNSDGGWALPSTQENTQVAVKNGSPGDQWIITPATPED